MDFSNSDVTRPAISNGEPGQTAPTPEETDDGGAATAPAKKKKANPVRAQRSRVRIDPGVMALIDQQGDGTYKNGRH